MTNESVLCIEIFHIAFFMIFYIFRYLSVVKEEGLEISQPALDPDKSKVHHPITVRRQRSRCHRLGE